MRIPKIAQSAARRLERQEGFSLVELLIAMLVMVIGIIAMVATLDGSRSLANTSERLQAASAVAQRQIETVSARLYLTYDNLAMNATLTNDANDQVRRYICGGSFRWNQSACAGGSPDGDVMVVNTTSGTVTPVTTWSDARTGARGNLYTIITWVDDSCPDAPRGPSSSCPGNQDYKRITVAATSTNGAPRRPVIMSTIAPNPNGLPLGDFVNPYTIPGLEY